MSIPRISIVTACRNAEAHIEQTIQSVVDQNYGGLEYIIVDGKSNDRTMEIVSRFGPRIDRWVSEEDGGISDAFNKGIRMATGDLVGIVSADDYLLPGALESVAEEWRVAAFPEIVHGNILFLDSLSGSPTIVKPDPDLRKIWRRQPLKHASVFVAASAYKNFGVFSNNWRYAMDYDLVLRFYLAGCRFHYLNQTLAAVRPGGRSYTSISKPMWETCQIAELHGSPRWKARTNFLWKLVRCHVRAIALRPVFRIPLRAYRAINPRFEAVPGKNSSSSNPQ